MGNVEKMIVKQVKYCYEQNTHSSGNHLHISSWIKV